LPSLVAGLQRELCWKAPAEVSDPYAVIDAFLQDESGGGTEGDLQAFLERQLRPGGVDSLPGGAHRQLAKMIQVHRVPALIDTNYDLVLRRALSSERVPYRFSTLDSNLNFAATAEVRYLALEPERRLISLPVLLGA
jgi:hypothetical protein